MKTQQDIESLFNDAIKFKNDTAAVSFIKECGDFRVGEEKQCIELEQRLAAHFLSQLDRQKLQTTVEVMAESELEPLVGITTQAQLSQFKFEKEKIKLIQQHTSIMETKIAQEMELSEAGIDILRTMVSRQLQSLEAKINPSYEEEICFDENYEFPGYNYLCKDLNLYPGAASFIVAEGGAGKTMLAQHIAVCIATGLPIFNKFPVRQGRVLHLDFDRLGIKKTRARYTRLFEGLGKCSITYDRPTFKLDDWNGRDKIKTRISGYDLVIIDAFRGAIAGDESDSKARIPVDMLSDVCNDTNCSLIILHHAGKGNQDKKEDKDKGRGSSALFDAARSWYILSNNKEEKKFELTESKNADEQDFPGVCYRLENFGPFVEALNASKGIRIVASDEVVKSKKVEKTDDVVLLEYLSNIDDAYWETLQQATCIPEKRFAKARRDLKEKNFIKEEPRQTTGEKARSKVFLSITATGREYLETTKVTTDGYGATTFKQGI